ncbi:response regulator transcription factor [Photobacterium sp. CCB-ST2H9]|uniref:response regulator transcription factor n=1 Tax=Photobacterium sp. CCB-ST2H9 TaxID=2912855 RepID=UPI0020054434|nr:response regulator transcription factor [Photobacterium sp. CCB-ST2H9]UTM59696.1 response regulator transcription factor [Photobacterium sp. CCB-ST2H9]
MLAQILVIDDEPEIQRFIRISLKAEGFSYAGAGTGAEGLNLFRQSQPELIILDLGLPDVDGYELLKTIRETSLVPILVLTARDEEDEMIKLLDAGANDYLCKPFSIRTLIARINVLLRDFSQLRQAATEAHVMNFQGLQIDSQNHQVYLHGNQLSLSKKEFRLLHMLAERRGCLVTQKELLVTIWGDTHAEDTHYLRNFVSHLRKKLQDDADNPTYIQTEPGVGYRLLGNN